MKRLITAAAVLAVAFVGAETLQEPANADFDGAMSTPEYNWIDTTIPDANTRAEVVDHCNCAGINIWTGFHNGNPAKAKQYRWNNGDNGSTVIVYYVERGEDDTLTAYDKFACSSDCVEGNV